MSDIKVSNEIIGKYLEGQNDDKYIVAVEANYYQNIASLVISDPERGKYIKQVTFKPFLWFKHDVTSILYGGKRIKILDAMKKYKIKITELKTSNSEGFSPERMINGYKFLAKSDESYNSLLKFFRDGGIDIFSEEYRKYFMTCSPTEQFLIQTGRRLFKGFEEYDEVHRLQFDLETTGLFPESSAIFQIGIKDNRGFERVLEVRGDNEYERRDAERLIIHEFFRIVGELQPDIISGYNSENFDWNFIDVRCSKLGINIEDAAITLNDSKITRKKAQVKYGGEVEHYTQTYMWGTNIIDIMHSVRRAMAINSEIKEYGLKYITKFSKIAKLNRVYVPGDKIHKTWADTEGVYYFNEENGDWFLYNENNPSHVDRVESPTFNMLKVNGSYIVERYLIDDLWETEKIDERFNQATFLIGKLVPTSYMKNSTMGTAGIWKLIMMGWSYENNLAIPALQEQQTFTGGLSRLLSVGYARNVAKLDYAALYPNIELTHDIFPDIDISGVLKGMLLYIAETRDTFKALKGEHGDKAKVIKATMDSIIDKESIEYKKLYIQYDQEKSLEDKFDKKQLPVKILANSFFGSYGAPHLFPWGDIECAEETTCRGRQYLRLMVSHFHEKHGFKPLVGDSVTHDTPVYIINNHNNTIDIVPICDLFNENSNNLDKDKLRDYEDKPYKVLTRGGWKNIKYVYRHDTTKNIHRIITKDRLINVTEDHSLFQNGVEIKPSSLVRGDLIDTYEIPFNIDKNIVLNENEAFLYGFFLGDGSSLNSKRKKNYISKKTGITKTYLVKRSDWKISNTRLEYLEKLQIILKENFNINSVIKNHLKSSGVYNLVVHNSKFSNLFCDIFYTSYREKKIPKTIINSELNIKRAFIEGVFSSDGYGDTIETCSSIGMKSQIAMSGISLLLKELNIEYKITTRKDKENFITFVLKNSNRNNPPFTNKTRKKTSEVWKNEIISNKDKNNYVYDISTEDGTFICGINGVIAHNTDGFNFGIPDDIENFKYYVTGSHRLTEHMIGKTISGLKAVVAEFNEVYMLGRMGLDIDDICSSTINFARKNYANDIGGKIKLVGNSIKSKKMPKYIEEFLDTGIRLLLDGKGSEFIDLYYKTADTIVNYEVPIAKIASKARVKLTVDNYKKKMAGKTEKGNQPARQAHMELIIQNDLVVNVGDVITYVNTGETKSQGDIKTVKDKDTGKIIRVDLMCTLIPQEAIDFDPNYTSEDYNAPKYLAAFNKRIKPLLVCFHPDVRDKVLLDFKKDRKLKEYILSDKNYFTHKQCELTSGFAYKDGDQDDYDNDLMKMEDKEILFWTKYNKIPNHFDLSKWNIVKEDYFVRMVILKAEETEIEKTQFENVIRRFELDELYGIHESGKLPLQLSFLKIEFNDEDSSKTNLVSARWGTVITPLINVFKYVEMADDRHKFYNENPSKGDYYSWVLNKSGDERSFTELMTTNKTKKLKDEVKILLNEMEYNIFNEITSKSKIEEPIIVERIVIENPEKHTNSDDEWNF